MAIAAIYVLEYDYPSLKLYIHADFVPADGAHSYVSHVSHCPLD